MFNEIIRATASKITDLLTRGQSVWVVLSQAEGDDSTYPPEKRIRADILQDVADHYDASHRRAPIIQAVEGITGKAHERGELNPPIGWFEELSFDGLSLWGRAKDVNGNLARHIANGMVRGSVWIWPGNEETDGHWWLRHFALIAGQPTGTAGLPHLDEFWVSVEPGQEEEARSLLERSYLARSIDFGREEDEMDKEALEGLARSIQEGLPAMLQSALKAEREETTSGIMREINEKVVAPLKTEIENLKAATESVAKSANESRIRSTVEQLSKEGKVFPAEVDGEVAMLVRSTPDEAEARIKLLGDRPAMSFEPTKNGKPGDSVKRDAELELLKSKIVSPRHGYDENELNLVRELMSEAGGDPVKFRELAFAREEN